MRHALGLYRACGVLASHMQYRTQRGEFGHYHWSLQQTESDATASASGCDSIVGSSVTAPTGRGKLRGTDTSVVQSSEQREACA
jgi:hypothetical protein